MLASRSPIHHQPTMDGRHSYDFTYQQPTATAAAPRYNASHGTSSAFSANANPNEDWTKISDLAERRRIQNRIAQRNYRKKLKRRLEDLEKKAATGESSPPPEKRRGSGERSRSNTTTSTSPRTASNLGTSSRSAAPSDSRYYNTTSSSPELTPVDYLDDGSRDLFDRGYNKSPPMYSGPASTYSYASADQTLYAPYPALQGMSVGTMNPAFTAQAPPSYTLPSESRHSQQQQQATLFADEDLLNSFNVSYSSLSSLEAPIQYPEYGTNSPPSFGLSPANSPSDSSITFPTTPVDVPDSPQFKLPVS